MDRKSRMCREISRTVMYECQALQIEAIAKQMMEMF